MGRSCKNADTLFYFDPDIVALIDWERLFEFSGGYDVVHADEEYTTLGIYNYDKPNKIEEIFGHGSLNTAITAGHILVKKNPKMIVDMNSAVDWFKENSDIPKKHDQSLLHIATLLGNWKLLNLCKPPHNWLSSWSGDYKNSLDLILVVQGDGMRKTASFKAWFSNLSEEDKNQYEQKSSLKDKKVSISHLHYSGRGRLGADAIDDFMFSSQTNENRMMRFFKVQFADMLYITHVKGQIKRVKRHLKH